MVQNTGGKGPGGAGAVRTARDAGLTRPLDLHVGLDFGTCFTKLCCRHLGRDESFVVRLGVLGTGLEDALIPSVVGIAPDGRLVGGLTETEWRKNPEPSLQRVRFLKMLLAGGRVPHRAMSWAGVSGLKTADEDRIRALSTYFIYRVLDRFRGWARHHFLGAGSTRPLRLSFSLGVPVEQFDSPARRTFQGVLNTACRWLDGGPIDGPWTLERALKLMASGEGRESRETVADTVPEIAAAVHAFLASRQSQRGVYFYLDIGGGTLDAVAFKRWDKDGEPQVNFYCGKVEPLGLDALSEAAARRLDREPGSLLHYLSRSEPGPGKRAVNPPAPRFSWMKGKEPAMRSTGPASPGPVADEGIFTLLEPERRLIHRQVGTVLATSLKKDPVAFRAGRGDNPFQKDPGEKIWVFSGGGGAASTFYAEAVDEAWRLRLKQCGLPGLSRQVIEVPGDLEFLGLPASSYRRFDIAYGLSIPEEDRFRAWMPSLFEPQEEDSGAARGLDHVDTHDWQ